MWDIQNRWWHGSQLVEQLNTTPVILSKYKANWYRRLPGLFESLSMLLLAVDDNDGDGEDVTTIDTPGDGDWFTETSKADF